MERSPPRELSMLLEGAGESRRRRAARSYIFAPRADTICPLSSPSPRVLLLTETLITREYFTAVLLLTNRYVTRRANRPSWGGRFVPNPDFNVIGSLYVNEDVGIYIKVESTRSICIRYLTRDNDYLERSNSMRSETSRVFVSPRLRSGRRN